MATRESSQTKTRQRGGAFKGETEEKGLDGKDSTESSKGKARLQTVIQIRSGYKCSIYWLGNNNCSKKQEDTEKEGNGGKMDVQMENTDPPPCESQSSGKIRKGFKLFGKRKPGNIFSIRSKGDGNNKSPVNRSKTLDGLSESAAPDSEHEPDMGKGQEMSQGEMEQAEEEPLCEDGVQAAAPTRSSISSTGSAKSLSFLSLLRGGRRDVGGRRVHTVSQPVGRQRRGLKDLFGNIKFRSKDKEDKADAPPSPLLMLSRANSVEIIKEDLTLTPKSQPRSLDSSESCEPVKSLTTQDSAATAPSETITPQVTAGNVSKTNEHVPPLPASEPPLVPGDNSLSSLLADISSLLTFDSISGGRDIMADVEAEWGKASSAISAVVTEVTPSSTFLFSKPTISSPLTSTSVSTAATTKPSPVVFPTTAQTQSFTPLTKTTPNSSPLAKPSSIITTLTKSSTLTTQTQSSDATSAYEPSNSIKIKSTFTPTAAKPSTTPVTLTSRLAPITSSPSITIKSTPSSTSPTTTVPPTTTATVVKAPSISPTLSSTANKLASEISAPPPIIASVSKISPVATPPPAPAKPPPVTHSPPTPVAFTHPPPAKFNCSTAGQSKAQVIVSPTCTVTNKPSFPAPVIPSKITTVPTPTTTSDSASVALSKSTLTSSPMDICPSSTLSATAKTQPSPASVPTPSSTSLDKIPSTTKPTPARVSLDKMPPAPTLTPAPTTHAVVSTVFPAPPSLGNITVSQSKAPPPALAQITISVSKDLPALTQMQVSHSKSPPAPAQIPISVSKDPPAPAQIQVPESKAPPAQIPVSVSKDPTAPACIPVSVSTVPPTPVCVPISVLKEPPALIPVSQSKAPTAPIAAPCPVTSPPSTPAPRPSEAPASAKMKSSGQESVDGQLTRPSSTDSTKTVLSKTEKLHNESRSSLQGPSRESRIPQVKASGLSKIPVVGGGRAGKLPVRDSQHVDDEASSDPPTPGLEGERPHFNSHDSGSKDKISDVGANVPTSKHTQEESQQSPQPKVLTSVPRDSKIPVKHGTQSHAASQILQAKEPTRTKIPVSKVPVRRVGNKPAAAGGSTQIRK